MPWPPKIDPTATATEAEAFETATTPPPEPKRPRGKPRRAEGIARKVMVRIDDATAQSLRSAFGSLGNALYHTFRGVQTLQALQKDAARAAKAKAEEPPPPPPNPELPDEDWELISRTLQLVADKSTDQKATDLETSLRRLELALGRPPRGAPFHPFKP